MEQNVRWWTGQLKFRLRDSTSNNYLSSLIEKYHDEAIFYGYTRTLLKSLLSYI